MLLNKLHTIISKFIWGGRKGRIKASIIHLPIARGGLATPNLMLDCYAAVIIVVNQWWTGRKIAGNGARGTTAATV